MSIPDKIYPLVMEPKIQMDGSAFSQRAWIYGVWCRFYNNLPKKIGGYQEIINDIPEIPRGIMVVPDPNPSHPNLDIVFRIFIGTANYLLFLEITDAGVPIVNPSPDIGQYLVDITPATGFVGDAENIWDFDVMYSSTTATNVIVAHAAPNLGSISNTKETDIFYGDLFGSLPLTQTGLKASGGMVCLRPFLFYYGNDGELNWTVEETFTNLEIMRPTGNKIVYGLPCRAGNSSPGGLFWSLDCLIRVTHTGATNVDFTADSITCESSVLSSQGIIEYDGVFYWAACDRFLMYNGTVQEVPNDTNLRYFFENINMEYRQKVWVTKNTKWGEIWWNWPSGNSTECDQSTIYSVRTKSWYNTPLRRSDGEFEHTFSFPIWSGNEDNGGGNYSLWMHETRSLNQVKVGNVVSKIPSSIVGGAISWCAYDSNGQRQDIDRWTNLYRFEPDITQVGDITMDVICFEYARQGDARDPATLATKTFTIQPSDQKIDIHLQGRIIYLRFSSDVIDGDFEFGQNLMVMRVGDARQ